MWDHSVITDKTIPANRPDIIVTDHVNKYIELADEIRRIWNQKEVKMIPMLVSATGIVPKNLFNSLKDIGLSQSVYIELQKQAILGTCHIVRKFMSQ
jgi:hypothetical protein